jgi:ATP/maltotriose-dependent transcriptional regulator MalT
MNLDDLCRRHDEAMLRGDTAERIAAMQQLVEFARRQGNQALEAGFLRDLANAFHEKGELRQAHALRLKASNLADHLGATCPSKIRVWIEGDLGRSFIEARNWPEAETHTERALAMATELGAERERSIYLLNLTLIYSNSGRMPEARRLLRRDRGGRGACQAACGPDGARLAFFSAMKILARPSVRLRGPNVGDQRQARSDRPQHWVVSPRSFRLVAASSCRF